MGSCLKRKLFVFSFLKYLDRRFKWKCNSTHNVSVFKRAARVFQSILVLFLLFYMFCIYYTYVFSNGLMIAFNFRDVNRSVQYLCFANNL